MGAILTYNSECFSFLIEQLESDAFKITFGPKSEDELYFEFDHLYPSLDHAKVAIQTWLNEPLNLNGVVVYSTF